MDSHLSPSSRQGLTARLNNWFYSREVPYALALLRITYPLALLVAVLPRWFHVRELYSSDGSPTPFWLTYGLENFLPVLSPEIAVALYTAMIFLMISASLGWKTRPCLLLLAVLIPYFGLVDSLGTLTKYTVFSFHILLLLGVSECGAVWSIDAWLQRRSQPEWSPPQAEIWPQRLIQLLIGVVYLASAATKIQTNGFFTGEQMYYWSLTNENFPNPVGEWLTLYPSLLVLSGLIAVAWELMFLFLVWRSPTRIPILGLGVFFHLMTFFMLGLFVFPLLFLSAYSCFLTRNEARRVGAAVSSLVPRGLSFPKITITASPVITWSLFAVLVGLTAVGGIAAERNLDVYGEHGAQGPIQLEPLASEAVAELLRNDQTVPVSDQLESIDLGSQTVGGFVANARTEFRSGETITLQARLIRPHQDLWIEHTVHDANGLVVARDGTIAAREEHAVNFMIPLGEQLSPGEYRIDVRLNGIESLSRKFILHNSSVDSTLNEE